jgi:hypothetical protein
MLSLAACCILCACGARPDPPGAASLDEDSIAAGSSEVRDDEVAVLGSEPSDPPPPSRNEPDPPDGGEPSAPEDEGAGVTKPEPAGDTLAACTKDGGDCLVINVAVSDLTNQSCIQLALDDCGIYTRGGLRVDVPLSWRVASATVAKLDGDCSPTADFDPNSASIVRAQGEITWNQDTAVPSDLAIDLTLEIPAAASLPAPRSVAGQLAGSVPECDG